MNILLVRPDGIGDEILCLPVASALRRSIPGVRITFLSSRYAAPLFEHHPDVDAVVTVTGRERMSELVRVFRGRFDAAVFLKPFRRLMTAAWLARVPLRVATGYRWYSFLANRRVYQHRRDFAKHETEYNVGLLAGLGLNVDTIAPPALVLTEVERAAAAVRLAALPVPRVVLHPGGFAARIWTPANYWSLAQRLAKEGIAVIFTGNVAERARFWERLGNATLEYGMLDLMGRLSLRELMAVVADSDAVVSGATGPAHMAAALGVPTVSLFDPRRNNLPTRWRPLGLGVVLRPDVPTCEKCIYEACPYWDCLDRITPAYVVDQIRAVVAQRPALKVVHV